MNTKKATKAGPGRGGAREGAGRPKAEDPRRNYVTVRLTDAEFERVKREQVETKEEGNEPREALILALNRMI